MSNEHAHPEALAVATVVPATSRRATQALVLIVCAGALAAAAMLEPDPRGLGTHERVGLPPCSFHLLTGIPCPGCGMTTAFANTVRLRLGAAFMANPFGMLLCAATAALGVFSLACLATGWEAWPQLRRLEHPLFVWGLLTLLFVSWGFKILITVA